MPVSRRHFLAWSTYTAGAAALLGCGARRASPFEPAPPGDEPPRPDAGPAGDEPASAARPNTLLILGGTGFLGPHVVEAALARGMKVTLFNRGKTNADLFPEVEKLRGDRDGKLDALRGRTWDAVVDTSGYVPRIVRASAELLAPSVQRYVFISSISAYGDFSREGITEEDPVATMPDETSEDVPAHYGALKALCERAAEQAMPGRVANIRPGLIVGPRDDSDRFTYWPVRIARGGEVLAPGTGQDPVQLIDVRDLAEWIVHVVENRRAGVYNAVGPAERMTMRDMLGRTRDALGSAATFTWADAKFLEEQGVQPWSHMPVWVPSEDDSRGMGTVNVSKAMGDGLRFRPIEDTAQATLAWFQTLPAERQAKLRAGITAEREAEVLAAWKARQQPDQQPGQKPGQKKPGQKSNKTPNKKPGKQAAGQGGNESAWRPERQRTPTAMRA
ncbi:MAG TPA: SDR family oxidoreductase [Haliangium sp.]|nr:SDR family oxidoreductase [Haliangium sp.]